MENINTKIGIPVDITLEGSFEGSDLFFSVIQGIFSSPNGSRMSIPGFYRGGGKWSVRFSAMQEGEWYYQISSNNVIFKDETTGTVTIQGEEPGITKLLRAKGTNFVDIDGKPVFLIGNECNFLFSLLASPDGFSKLKTFVKNIKESGFNQVQINTYAYDYSYRIGRTRENDYGPPYIELWEKTHEGRRFNPAFFDNYDKLIDYLHRNGIYAHIYLRVYNKYVDLPENYSEEDYAYYRLFTARYQAYPNVIWDISKEGYFEPDKEYFFTMLSQIRAWDAYKHLCTVHDDLHFSLNENYGTVIDFLTVQQHNDWQHAHLYFVEKSGGKPVVGGEAGLECPEGEALYNGYYCYDAKRICSIAWEIVMAGAYFQYYHALYAWDVIEYDKKPEGYEYISRLVTFFAQFDLTKFKSARHLCVQSGLCLDDGESTLIIYVEPAKLIKDYVNNTGRAMLNLKSERNIVSCEVMGVYSGKKEKYDLLSEESHAFNVSRDKGNPKRTALNLSVFKSYSDEPAVFVVTYSCKRR